MIHTPEEMKEAAGALLAICRQVMTGREIYVCERIQSSDIEEDIATRAEAENAEKCPHCDEILDEDLIARLSTITGNPEDELAVFRNLEIQFSREIAEHIDAGNRAASRLAVETHGRLNPEFKLVA